MSRLPGVHSPRSARSAAHNFSDDGYDDPRRVGTLDHISAMLVDIASAEMNSVEVKLGLSESALIALDIVRIAKHAKSSRKACSDIAAQVYFLLSAVDGGVKGHAIDPSRALKAHIEVLNQDLKRLYSLLACFESWMSAARVWQAENRLHASYDILGRSMDAYLRLLHAALAQPPKSKRRAMKGKFQRVPSESLGQDMASVAKNSNIKPRKLPAAFEQVLKAQHPAVKYMATEKVKPPYSASNRDLPPLPRGEPANRTQVTGWVRKGTHVSAPPPTRAPPPPPVEAYIKAARLYQAALRQDRATTKVVTFSPTIAKGMAHSPYPQFRNRFTAGPREAQNIRIRTRQHM